MTASQLVIDSMQIFLNFKALLNRLYGLYDFFIYAMETGVMIFIFTFSWQLLFSFSNFLSQKITLI